MLLRSAERMGTTEITSHQWTMTGRARSHATRRQISALNAKKAPEPRKMLPLTVWGWIRERHSLRLCSLQFLYQPSNNMWDALKVTLPRIRSQSNSVPIARPAKDGFGVLHQVTSINGLVPERIDHGYASNKRRKMNEMDVPTLHSPRRRVF